MQISEIENESEINEVSELSHVAFWMQFGLILSENKLKMHHVYQLLR